MNDVIYRRGRQSDVNNIAALINGYAAERVMLPKTPDAISLAIEDFIQPKRGDLNRGVETVQIDVVDTSGSIFVNQGEGGARNFLGQSCA